MQAAWTRRYDAGPFGNSDVFFFSLMPRGYYQTHGDVTSQSFPISPFWYVALR